MKAAIRDDNPVVVFEHKMLYGRKGEVADGDAALVPIGKASVRRSGGDVTIVAAMAAVEKSLAAAEELAPRASRPRSSTSGRCVRSTRTRSPRPRRRRSTSSSSRRAPRRVATRATSSRRPSSWRARSARDGSRCRTFPMPFSGPARGRSAPTGSGHRGSRQDAPRVAVSQPGHHVPSGDRFVASLD